MPIEQNGSVTRGTRANLIDGLRSAPMSAHAVDAVMEQAVQFATQLVDTYSAEIAAGEVGEGGTSRATANPIIGDTPPSALLYGRVQSGKTVGMILTSALCLDNGFRVIVVLTTDNVALVKQTASRFKTLDGPRVFSGAKDGANYEWEGQEEQLREFVGSDGLVLVCAKNSFNLPQVIRFLQQLDASSYPVLVLDDEADAATPDTTIAARSAGRPNAPSFASTINRLVIENDRPQQEGFSLGEALPHSLFVQVTATPFVLLLQKAQARIRPNLHFLLEPGEGYCGGEVFFGDFDPTPGAVEQPNTIVLVGDNEAALMRRQVPAGLARSIDFFILSACARAREANWPPEGFKHLSHTSHRIDDHDVAVAHIETHLNGVRQLLRQNDEQTREHFHEAYQELCRSIGNEISLDELIIDAERAIRQVDIARVNSKADSPAYGPRLNFVVGGNILGRGLTIDDLLVTYYIREARTSQMDTVWQHARMYGYRRSYLNYTRVYIPRRLALRFKQIHEAEENLRELLGEGGDVEAVVIEVPTAARPTRPNALEAGVVQTLQAGRDQLFPLFYQEDARAAAEVLRMLNESQVPIAHGDRADRAAEVDLEVAVSLVQSIPLIDDEPGLWSPEAVTALLFQFREQLNGRCTVYVRETQANPPNQGWIRGRLNGHEIQLIRDAAGDGPGLALMYVGDPAEPIAWYPTLVLPRNTPTLVFSAA